MRSSSVIVFASLLVYCLGSVVRNKKPQYVFKPTFDDPFESVKRLVEGTKNELRDLFTLQEKILFLTEFLRLQKKKIVEDSIDFYNSPYVCGVEGAELDPTTNICYSLEIVNKKNWTDARQECLIQGGDLAMPLFNNEAIKNFLANTFADGYLSRSEKNVYLGIRAQPLPDDSGFEYAYLNGLVVPNDPTLFSDIGGPAPGEETVATLSLPVDGSDTASTIQFSNSDRSDLRGYICQFRAFVRLPDAFPYGPVFDALFEEYSPNPEDVEHAQTPSKTCFSEDQIAIGSRCYKYFAICKPYQDAIHACHEDGGELALVPLNKHERFGGVLADFLSDTVASNTPIWINAQQVADTERLLDDFTVDPTLCLDRLRTLSTLRVATRQRPSRLSRNTTDVSTTREDPDPGIVDPNSALALILPESTPDNFLDNFEWNVFLFNKSRALPYLCQYKADHRRQ